MVLGSAIVSVLDVVAPLLLIGAITLLAVVLAPKGARPSDEEWNGSVFYSNTRDRALLVPKRYGVGYTLNFGNPWAWALLVLILLAVVAPFFVTWMSLGHLRR